uniref:serine--tRNA ligase n=1 Tax=Candidatus Shikimatogenerans sp. AspAUS03 TaxID=3158563 RepID=A0AAU7QSQ4_9FLAO
MILIKKIKKKYNQIIKLLKFKNKDYINIINNILCKHIYLISLEKERLLLNKFLKKNINNNVKKKIINILKIYKNIIKYNKKYINKKLILIPNIPDKSYKSCNYTKDIIIYNNIYKYKLLKKKIDHIKLGEKYNILNFKISSNNIGTGFYTFINKGAILHDSLINFIINENMNKGYIKYIFPYLINKNSLYGTGQIPDKEKQLYKLKSKNYYLIPTGEVPLINYWKNTVISEKQLPVKGTTYTSCFRKETGHYGIKNKGLKRLHQFDKIEIIMITTRNSNIFLNIMLNHIKNILKKIKVPFRIKKLSIKNLNFTSSLTYDFELYSLVQNKWFEISSLSNCKEFQSNRLNIRYKIKNKYFKCHTLNGSCLSIPRLLMIILENNQKTNYIKIPKIITNFTKFKIIK